MRVRAGAPQARHQSCSGATSAAQRRQGIAVRAGDGAVPASGRPRAASSSRRARRRGRSPVGDGGGLLGGGGGRGRFGGGRRTAQLDAARGTEARLGPVELPAVRAGPDARLPQLGDRPLSSRATSRARSSRSTSSRALELGGDELVVGAVEAVQVEDETADVAEAESRMRRR